MLKSSEQHLRIGKACDTDAKVRSEMGPVVEPHICGEQVTVCPAQWTEITPIFWQRSKYASPKG
jgi:hypothetical protein